MALKPELRQNFTVDPEVLGDVAKALEIHTNDKIIEIGPGKGVLTLKILNTLKHAKTEENKVQSLVSFEVDEDLREDLESIKRRFNGIFDYRIQSFLDAKPKPGFNKCTGNIPYHISEPLLFKFIDWNFEEIVMITGIKFARKVCGEIEGKIATISIYLFDSEILKEYDKNIFFPKSKVDSALLKMKRKTEFKDDKEKLLSQIMSNTDKKHLWLNKLLGYDQGQTGQIYHMDLEKLVEDVRKH